MAAGPFAKRIAFNRNRARMLARQAKRLHVRAARVAQFALAAKAKKWHKVAARRMCRALTLKAMAVRHAVRARTHRIRIAQIKQARQAWVRQHAN